MIKVKQLVWSNGSAQTPIRGYQVVKCDTDYMLGISERGATDWTAGFASADQAKAAAQADFERRVMECLEVEG